MLIDKRSILKEAQAKAAAKNVPAAGGNNRMATKKTSAKAEKAVYRHYGSVERSGFWTSHSKKMLNW